MNNFLLHISNFFRPSMDVSAFWPRRVAHSSSQSNLFGLSSTRHRCTLTLFAFWPPASQVTAVGSTNSLDLNSSKTSILKEFFKNQEKLKSVRKSYDFFFNTNLYLFTIHVNLRLVSIRRHRTHEPFGSTPIILSLSYLQARADFSR